MPHRHVKFGKGRAAGAGRRRGVSDNGPMRLLPVVSCVVGLAVVAFVGPLGRVQAQQAPARAASAAGPPGAASAAAPARAAASAPAGAPSATPGQRIEIIGGRDSDSDARRRSTAAKIVIGREEIEKFGDTSVGEVLRRLPGVTTAGAPGRGGAPRMRGLGSGYTQLLIDGQRLPPGFSLDSLTPEQIERIEILRAPTAETGARAIAGTINIVTREGFKRRLNDVRVVVGYDNGGVSPGAHFMRNDSVDNFTYNVLLGVNRPHRITDSDTETRVSERATGVLLEDTIDHVHSEERRTGVALSSRLQWRFGETGDNLLLTPRVFHNEGRTDRSFTHGEPLPGPVLPGVVPYDSGTSDTTSRFTNAGVGLQWRQRLGPVVRMELNGNLGQWRSSFDTQRDEFLAGVFTRGTDDVGRTRERSANLTAKFSGVLVPGAAPTAPASEAASTPASAPGQPARPAPPAPPAPPEHSLVGGVEVETVKRNEYRLYTDRSGSVIGGDFGDTFEASTLRLAAYLQDEWNLDAHWAFHAGLRWEGITTDGDAGGGERPTNRSGVTTPLVHLLWKPDPAKRDQVRLSLTRSYRAPSTQNLIARPSIHPRAPETGPNTPTTPDTIGNPDLRPEVANGVDLAFERFLDGGGVLSANVFHRRIRDLMRRVVALETVPWSPVDRYVSRIRNVGAATSTGLELEAKYRLDQIAGADAPRVELRHNVAFYRSRVEGVPGPDNRLDEQAKVTANLGADYRLRSVPLTLGGNVNFVPGYRTQTADDRAVSVSGKRVVDVFALWTLSPAVGLRLLVNNAAPRDYTSTTEFDYTDALRGDLRETAATTGPTSTNWQLRLELKL